ncbi:hypothetical protein RHMOL_Rhmol01G0048100 [Rhododendron molle]|uniref:Uncharacterized protein n=1 Tax=Rhododendron molle TaxID=49168 RepID=A0ACC0PYN1_RHOML|nr:hypothetical protein RHMOL_Rhmol01G0048100 [Rhododendron molle]
MTGLKTLDLSNNNLSGEIPVHLAIGCRLLKFLRLSNNFLKDPLLPHQNNLTLLQPFLAYGRSSLANNSFEGNIPKELCNLSRLTMIDLSVNNLSGSIPPCISNIEFNGINVGGSSYVLYRYVSPQTFTLLLHDLGMVLAKSEKDQEEYFDIEATGQEAKFTTKGMSLTYRGIVLHLFSGINLSHNRLTGPIPPEIGNLTDLKVLNLSHNNFVGTIPVTFSNLKGIECLDLSYNRLNGIIPSELTVLNSLAIFNLSYDNLSGRMPPRVNQFGTFESSSYVGNPLLCGEPLPMKCNATNSPPSTPRASLNDIEEDSGFMDMNVFYMSFAGSYVTVVLAIVAILLINIHIGEGHGFILSRFPSPPAFIVDNLVGRRRCFLWK